jgi:hypothetical protein
MLTTVESENSGKIEKKVLESQPKNLQDMLLMKVSKENIKADLIDFEAGIMFVEELIKWLETFIQSRKNATGNHFIDVERRVDELSTSFLGNYKKDLQASVDAWGRRPFEDYIHEKGVYE